MPSGAIHSQAKFITIPVQVTSPHVGYNFRGTQPFQGFDLMLPDLQLNNLVRLRKPHPCGSDEWTVVRLGADIGLECKGCGHRVMLTRRELAKRMKANLTKKDEQPSS
jgi:hypothetical protein